MDGKTLYPLGSRLPEGIIRAIHYRDGERTYMCVDSHGVVSLVPQTITAPRAEPRREE